MDGAAAAAATPSVRLGDRGHHVTEVQYILRSHGYSIGVDGIFGKETRAAVLKWQRANRLKVDGVVGPLTWFSLSASVHATASVPATRLNPPSPPSLPSPPSNESVADIIRDEWPDQLENEAIRIATRESSLVPTVKNYCCWGLFQIYWGVHHAWLCADLGICDPHQLWDARTNARAGYALYQRDGGWGPWALG
jgi:hypothetical protein